MIIFIIAVATKTNAAMIAVAGYFHYLAGERAPLDIAPVSRIADF